MRFSLLQILAIGLAAILALVLIFHLGHHLGRMANTPVPVCLSAPQPGLLI